MAFTAPLVALALLAAAPGSGGGETIFGEVHPSAPLPPTGSWSQTFDPPSLATYLDGDARSILVTAGDPSARDAATALEGALRATARTQVVMNDAQLGSLAGMSDPQIVQRCEQVPVDLVVVIRAFAGGPGRPPVAVVTFYDKRASPLAALTVPQGGPLAPRTTAGAGQGTTGKALAAVVSVANNPGAATSAQEQYEEAYIWFTDQALVNRRTGQIVSTWSEPVQGKYRRPLRGAQFYRMVDRLDLAAKYESRNTLRWSLGIGGTLGVLAGGTVALVGLAGHSAATLWTGVAVAGLGTIAVTAPGFIDPNPVDPPTARQLADEYNQRLKTRLGLSERDGGTSKAPLHLAGWLEPKGAGLAIGGEL